MILKEVCTGAELALLLGITERHVQGLAARGVLTKADRGQYRVQLSVSGYIEYLRKGQPDQAESKRLEKARTKLTEEKAELARMEREERAGDLVSAKDQRRRGANAALAIRNALQNIPSRISQELAIETDANNIYRRLETEISAALVEAHKLIAENILQEDGVDVTA